MKPDFSEKSQFKDKQKVNINIGNLLKVEKKDSTVEAQAQAEVDQPFTPEQLKKVWDQFAETRKKFQAEYHLLTQGYELNGTQITLHLHNAVQELMLNNMRMELSALLRDKLKNNSITLTGIIVEQEERKVIYTNREKFDYLVERNPLLKELKDRLGLDTDF
jgi:hypothetical protein